MPGDGWLLVDVNELLDRRSRELADAGFELDDDEPDPWPAIPD